MFVSREGALLSSGTVPANHREGGVTLSAVVLGSSQLNAGVSFSLRFSRMPVGSTLVLLGNTAAKGPGHPEVCSSVGPTPRPHPAPTHHQRGAAPPVEVVCENLHNNHARVPSTSVKQHCLSRNTQF